MKKKKFLKNLQQEHDDYATGNLLDYLNHQNYYEVIVADLLRQTNTSICQQINLIESLEGDGGASVFFIAKQQ